MVVVWGGCQGQAIANTLSNTSQRIAHPAQFRLLLVSATMLAVGNIHDDWAWPALRHG